MLTEGGLLVPYWRSLECESFHQWYGANAARLVHFFGLLTWIAGLTALAAALLSFATVTAVRSPVWLQPDSCW